LPWLHPKYFPIWGVCLLAFGLRARRLQAGWRPALLGLGLPVVAAGLECLYVFHISGSLLPDSLWVLNGYPRGGALVNRETLSGLYYLFLDRAEGLWVYGPHYVAALAGMLALRRKSPRAFWLSLAIFVPYLLVAAAHDRGGAGGWAPPTRYLVPVIPVMAMWLAAWLGCAPEGRAWRWSFFLATAAASFWIGWGMLAEIHFPYDRSAFLASGAVNPSLALGSVLEPQPVVQRLAYPVFLLMSLGLLALGERQGRSPTPLRISAALAGLILVMGLLVSGRSPGDAWYSPKRKGAAERLRPGRAVTVMLPECSSHAPRLRFQGTLGPHTVTVAGAGFSRRLTVPAGGPSQLPVPVHPIRRVTQSETESLRPVRVELEPGQASLVVQPFCR
ncbi:MAG: hypothetical protein ACE5JI_05685, partial [Acidobacteriota bacterium]